MVAPINIPDDWEDNGLILFEEFCELIRTPQRTVRGGVRTLSHLVRREDAEDISQEAFARLHQRWAKISRYERPDA